MIASVKQKFDLYQTITDRMIEALESGTVAWNNPMLQSNGMGRHINAVTFKPYRGINAILTSLVAQSKGYAFNLWATYNQWDTFGGNVRQGEKGLQIVFYKPLESKTQFDASGKPKKHFILQYYTVFNLAQIEGLDSLKAKAMPTPKAENQAIEACETLVKSFLERDGKLTVNHTVTGKAYYVPSTDSVFLPQLNGFTGSNEYYSTLFHELGHATGHSSRLNREGLKHVSFGSHTYGKEELVAELTSAFLCGETGILPATLPNSVAYCQSWLKVLKANDSKFIFEAASQAQKATDLILGNAKTMPSEESEA